MDERGGVNDPRWNDFACGVHEKKKGAGEYVAQSPNSKEVGCP